MCEMVSGEFAATFTTIYEVPYVQFPMIKQVHKYALSIFYTLLFQNMQKYVYCCRYKDGEKTNINMYACYYYT